MSSFTNIILKYVPTGKPLFWCVALVCVDSVTRLTHKDVNEYKVEAHFCNQFLWSIVKSTNFPQKYPF